MTSIERELGPTEHPDLMAATREAIVAAMGHAFGRVPHAVLPREWYLSAAADHPTR
jgi:hypothetical protein